MIRYTLKCRDDHVFESWFRSAQDFDLLLASGHVACPNCGAQSVEKALMAPKVRPARKFVLPEAARDQVSLAEGAPAAQSSAPNAKASMDATQGPASPETGLLSAPASERESVLAALRRHIESRSEYLGKGFAQEARRIHSGEAPDRMIHGEARRDEAEALLAEGVPVMPLPFLPGRKRN